MQKMADDWAAAFNKGHAARVASFYKSDATLSWLGLLISSYGCH